MPYRDIQKKLEYNRKWNKEYYRKNKDKEKRRVAKRKAEIAKWFLKVKSTFRCKICGEKETVCLDFHHLSKKRKDFSLGSIKAWGWGKKRIMKELKKCTVLCANCHRKVHAKII